MARQFGAVDRRGAVAAQPGARPRRRESRGGAARGRVERRPPRVDGGGAAPDRGRRPRRGRSVWHGSRRGRVAARRSDQAGAVRAPRRCGISGARRASIATRRCLQRRAGRVDTRRDDAGLGRRSGTDRRARRSGPSSASHRTPGGRISAVARDRALLAPSLGGRQRSPSLCGLDAPAQQRGGLRRQRRGIALAGSQPSPASGGCTARRSRGRRRCRGGRSCARASPRPPLSPSVRRTGAAAA